MAYVKEWMKRRGEDDCPYLFITRSSLPDGDKFNYWCRHVFSKILGKRIHPHMIRRTRATHSAKDGASIEAVQELLGHKSASTTKIYIQDDRDHLEGIF